MSCTPKPRGYWTKAKCREVAQTYDSLADFIQHERSCYVKARENGWLSFVTKGLKRSRKEKGFWTKARCRKEALRYSSVAEFYGSPAHRVAGRNGWLRYVTKGLARKMNTSGHWTFARIKQAAKTCQDANEFRLLHNPAYGALCKMRRREELYSVMPKGWVTDYAEKDRFVYVVSAPCLKTGKTRVYIGLTVNLAHRMSQHKIYTKGFKDLTETPGFSYVVQNKGKALPEKDAVALEQKLVDRYGASSKHVLMNKSKQAGQLGPKSTIKWTLEKVLAEAAASSRACRMNNLAYQAACRNSWLPLLKFSGELQ